MKCDMKFSGVFLMPNRTKCQVYKARRGRYNEGVFHRSILGRSILGRSSLAGAYYASRFPQIDRGIHKYNTDTRRL